MKDLKNNIKITSALKVTTLSGVTPGVPSIVDCLGFDSVTLVVATGNISDAGTVDGIGWELTECDTSNGTYTPVGANDLIGEMSDLAILSDTDDDKIIGKIGYRGTKRYLKLTPTGSTGTNATVYAHAILGHPHLAPTE